VLHKDALRWSLDEELSEEHFAGVEVAVVDTRHRMQLNGVAEEN
jgi:hypothetical protein